MLHTNKYPLALINCCCDYKSEKLGKSTTLSFVIRKSALLKSIVCAKDGNLRIKFKKEISRGNKRKYFDSQDRVEV